jgi:hypothetical protein
MLAKWRALKAEFPPLRIDDFIVQSNPEGER